MAEDDTPETKPAPKGGCRLAWGCSIDFERGERTSLRTNRSKSP